VYGLIEKNSSSSVYKLYFQDIFDAMLTVLIVENEASLRKGLRTMLEVVCAPGTKVLEADGVQAGLQAIHQDQPDIVLLDIEMDDGTGFDLLRQVITPGFQLIFTTAHDQYALQAIKFSALDYLLKPIDPDELRSAIQKASEKVQHADLQAQIGVMMQMISGNRDADKRLVLNDKQSTYFLRIADILFCEAEGPYTRFFSRQNDPILISKNLKEYEEMLTPMGFIRTHHSYLVNPTHIQLYDKTDGGALILEGGFSIPISQRRKDFVMQTLESK
jgi:two-component system LytT family response regulator